MSKECDILIFDTHPVQYRAPVWQQLNRLLKGKFFVVYQSDKSIAGGYDKGFGLEISWDQPLLKGYDHCFLYEHLSKQTRSNPRVADLINTYKPQSVLLIGIHSLFEWKVLFQCVIKGIPVWIRSETQDRAFRRNWIKRSLRYIVYRMVYALVAKAFYIGKLNKQHYLKHGVSESKLTPSLYCTVDRYQCLNLKEKVGIRNLDRTQAKIGDEKLVVGFSGKFIEKKKPDILFDMLSHLDSNLRQKLHLYFIGSGKLENKLKELAQQVSSRGVMCTFTGFINQSELYRHYLMIDILILPSQRMGETWGLVVNEGLQAGCSVIVSDSVGCAQDFKTLPRFRVFKTNNASDLARNLTSLSSYSRDFDWAREYIENYSVENSAIGIANEVKNEFPDGDV